MSTEFVVFDLETTGLSHRDNEIIQIAGTRMRNGTIVKSEQFFSYVRPDGRISAFITEYTGVSNRDVAKAPQIDTVLKEFSNFVGDSVLIAHNGNRFDAKFLSAACEREWLRARPVELIDSIELSKRVFGRSRGTGHGMDAVLDRLNVRSFGGRRHDARGDVSALAKAVEKMWLRLELDEMCSHIPRVLTQLPVISDR